MLCEKCKKRKATTFLSEDGATRNLCSACAKDSSRGADGITLSRSYAGDVPLLTELDFFREQSVKFPSVSSGQSNRRCPSCSSSLRDISRRGVGCAECFKTFESEPIFSVYPRPEISECAILPSKFRQKLEIRKRIDELRASIRLAIAEEDFELAASIRDKIRALQNEAV